MAQETLDWLDKRLSEKEILPPVLLQRTITPSLQDLKLASRLLEEALFPEAPSLVERELFPVPSRAALGAPVTFEGGYDQSYLSLADDEAWLAEGVPMSMPAPRPKLRQEASSQDLLDALAELKETIGPEAPTLVAESKKHRRRLSATPSALDLLDAISELQRTICEASSSVPSTPSTCARSISLTTISRARSNSSSSLASKTPSAPHSFADLRDSEALLRIAPTPLWIRHDS